MCESSELLQHLLLLCSRSQHSSQFQVSSGNFNIISCLSAVSYSDFLSSRKQRLLPPSKRKNYLADKLPALTNTSLGCFGVALQQHVSNFLDVHSEPVVETVPLSPPCKPCFLSKLWLFLEETALTAHTLENGCSIKENNYRKITFCQWLMFCVTPLPIKVCFLLFTGEMKLQLNSWLFIFCIREPKCTIKNPFKDCQTSVTVKSFLCVCIQTSVEKKW